MRITDLLPTPPDDGADLPCQWGTLTTTGPALEWPQDDHRRSTLAIGTTCDRPANHWASYACPHPDASTHGGHSCDDAPHEVFTICHNHAVYSYPIWKADDPTGLHGVASGYLVHIASHSEPWRQWHEAWSARQHAKRASSEGDTAHDRPLVYEPTLF
ncbi:hypothetical protein [Nesterenkonia sp. K-15-9-6]|uniref:hypothetical protein n=1 Tax=Nesterenkonia sp. K-15-9-6 TaxID=3093918 RepID=UPI004044AE5B